MKRTRAKLSDQIRKAIADAPMSRYGICKAIGGYSEATMSRFMAGKAGLSLDVLDRIADVIGMNIQVDPSAVRQVKKEG